MWCLDRTAPRTLQSHCWVFLLSVSIVTVWVKGLGHEIIGHYCHHAWKSWCHSGLTLQEERWRTLKEVLTLLHALWEQEEDTPNTLPQCLLQDTETLPNFALRIRWSARHWMLMRSLNSMAEARSGKVTSLRLQRWSPSKHGLITQQAPIWVFTVSAIFCIWFEFVTQSFYMESFILEVVCLEVGPSKRFLDH